MILTELICSLKTKKVIIQADIIHQEKTVQVVFSWMSIIIIIPKGEKNQQ